jgi:ATP-dependent Clp protease adapter protein ClpS
MPSIAEPIAVPKRFTKRNSKSDADLAPMYYVICWNDPVNLMNYVTHVFTLAGTSKKLIGT